MRLSYVTNGMFFFFFLFKCEDIKRWISLYEKSVNLWLRCAGVERLTRGGGGGGLQFYVQVKMCRLIRACHFDPRAMSVRLKRARFNGDDEPLRSKVFIYSTDKFERRCNALVIPLMTVLS